MTGVRVSGTGSYVPKNIITNEDISKLVDTNDEWISTRTGILERRISVDENTSDLSVKAAEEAIKSSNISKEEIGMIIVATMTPDMVTPSTACLVQKKLGLDNIPAFDISVACSGFVYATTIASQFILTGAYDNILVIGAEVLSKIVDWTDRNTCVLFGDGAGAVVLSKANNKYYNSILGANGKKGDALSCSGVALKNAYTPDVDLPKESYLYMDGKEVFKFATNIVVDTIEQLLYNYELSIDDIKHVVAHQANKRIIEYSCKKLKTDINKFYLNLDRYGNTSAASIPIALDEMNKKGILERGDKIIVVGFGAGLTYGASIIEW